MGRAVQGPGSVYLVGGASAVLFNWRATTIDIDIALAPEPAGLFAAIEGLKRTFQVSIELASPAQFVPPLPGWQGRSEFICRVGLVDFYHYDFYSQAFAKLSRGFERDLHDVASMVKFGKVSPQKLLPLFEQIVAELPRYPNLDPISLRQRLNTWLVHQGVSNE
jgi:hypothetical protein